ncbi:Mu transposase C-terminal domain-containing protein [Streptomyces ochraceiscleroticus]|uniref:Mu transposase C-terminal domain-containing protein n=1 Tax=Streptomyces ochraceiscleroticus TaxID=47761 RepID=A0ABW1MKH7_9ACTN|nr:Mu transposase C-terminal domain-containing protein [Streptomyces ochraceiscleroticus]
MSTAAARPQEACPHRGVLALGDLITWQNRRWTVTALSGASLRLSPESGGGCPVLVLMDALVKDGFTPLPDRDALPAATVPPLDLLEAVAPEVAKKAHDWERHIIEVHTGRLPETPEYAPPRAAYDPARHTLVERYQAKAAELSAAWGRPVSAKTVERHRLRWKRRGVWGLVDQRRIRIGARYGRVDVRVVKVLSELLAPRRLPPAADGTVLRRRLTAELVRRYKREARELNPSRPTFYRLLAKMGVRLVPLRAPRGSPLDAAGRPRPPYTRTVALAPGAVVQIDASGLDITVLGDDGRPTAAEFLVMVDVATRSILAALIRPKTPGRRRSTKGRKPGRRGRRNARSKGRAVKAVDATLLLAQALEPKPVRAHWPARARLEHSDLPHATLLAADPQLAGTAARPLIMPSLIVADNALVFSANAFTAACSYLGISPRPARKGTATDKGLVERSIKSMKTLFCQHVHGHTVREPDGRLRRGGDGQPLWTLPEINDLLQQWIAVGWQQRPHDELRDPLFPAHPPLTPNQMYAGFVPSEGYLPIQLSDVDRLNLLPCQWRTVTHQGIELNNRHYEAEELREYRGVPSPLRGQHRGKWPVHHNPYRPERVWLRDPYLEKDDPRAWVPADFIFRDRIHGDWTEYQWDQARAELREETGGSAQEEESARRTNEILNRAEQGPLTAQPEYPAGLAPAPRLPGPEPVDPYKGQPPVDPAEVRALPVTAAAGEDLFAGPLTAPPSSPPAAGSDGGEEAEWAAAVQPLPTAGDAAEVFFPTLTSRTTA